MHHSPCLVHSEFCWFWLHYLSLSPGHFNSQLASMLFCCFALLHVEGTTKDSLCCEPTWSRLLGSYSPPAPCGGKWVLWPGYCLELWRGTQHLPLTMGPLRMHPSLEDWREAVMAISSPFQAKILQLVWGWEMVTKILWLITSSTKYYCHTTGLLFKIKHLRILCSDSDLLGGDGVLIPSLEKHSLPSPLNINIYHELKRILIIKWAYGHSWEILLLFL